MAGRPAGGGATPLNQNPKGFLIALLGLAGAEGHCKPPKTRNPLGCTRVASQAHMRQPEPRNDAITILETMALVANGTEKRALLAHSGQSSIQLLPAPPMLVD